MKRIKQSSIGWYLLIFLLVQIPLAAFLFNEARQKENRYLDGKKETLHAEFRAVAASFARQAALVNAEITATPEIMEIVRDAEPEDYSARKILRQRLLAKTEPTFRTLRAQDFKYMHFQLADGTSFLRLHAPAAFGDPLFGFRPSVRIANTEKRYVEGFERGRHCYAFRYVFPLFAGEAHIGSLEISAPFSAVKKALLEIFKAEYSLHLKAEVDGRTLFPEDGPRYEPSDLLPGYLQERSAGQGAEGYRPLGIDQETMARINRKVAAVVLRKSVGDLGEDFATSTDDSGFLVIGLPIRNVEGQVAAFLVSYVKDSTPAAFRRIALITYGTVNLLLSLLLLLHRYAAGKMFDRLRFQQNLIDAIPTPVCFKDTTGEFLGCNTAFTEIIGLPQDRILGRTAQDIYPSEMADTVHLHDMAVLAKGGVEEYETTIKSPDNVFRHLITYKTPFTDQAGQVAGVIGSFVEVTERKQAEEALNQSYWELDQIFNTAADGMRVIDRDFIILQANDTFTSMVGRPKKEILGKKCYEVFSGSACRTPDCPLSRIVSGEKRFEGETLKRRPDGSQIPCIVTATPYRDIEGSLVGIIEDFKNISERKKDEEELRASEERYRELFENATDLIQIVAPDGHLLYVNRSWRRRFGYGRKEIENLTLADIVPPEHRKRHLLSFQRLLQGHRFDHAEIEFVARDGTRILAEGSANAQFANNRPVAVRCIFRDITRQRQFEAELKKARNLESIGTLAGGIAHDFNNILTSVLGNISLARLEKLPARTEECLTEAEKAALRARDLTKELITFARGGAPMKAMVSLDRLLRESVAFALRGSNVKGTFALGNDLWQVDADADQLAKVIQNLVINADDAMPGGGTITVQADNVTISEQDKANFPPGRYVRIAVVDQGLGILPDHMEKIFDPYFSTKERGEQKGMGLGLAVCHSIVSQHRGNIRVESSKNGTTFEVLLPAVADEQKAANAATVQPSEILKGRILLMDDDKTIQKVGAKMLRRLGFEVDLADDGKQVIEIYNAASEAGRPYHAVIMDLTVPGGMGGVEAIKELRAMDSGIKAIVSSGYAADPIMADHASHGFTAAVAKPYNLAMLRQTMQQVLGT